MSSVMDIPYEPPEREYEDTLPAFRDLEFASLSVRVEPDPLGSVNQIVRLMRGGRPVKSVLARVPVGSQVRLWRDCNPYTVDGLFAYQQLVWDSRAKGQPAPALDVREPGWRVVVDGRTVLAVTDAELSPPQVAARPSFYRRVRVSVRRWARSTVDGLAARLGYHREDECDGWD